MKIARYYIFFLPLAAVVLSGCETTSAALDGVGGVFVGAGQDVRRLAR